MISAGKKFAPERCDGVDSDTGHPVIQWTGSSHKDQHFYFTGPSVTLDNQWLAFISERDGHVNLFAVARPDGEITRLTANSGGQLRSYAYPRGGLTGISKASPYLDAKRNIVYYIQDHAVWVTTLVNPAPEKLCDLPDKWFSAYLHGSPDGSMVLASCTPPHLFSADAATHTEQLIATPKLIEAYDAGTTLYWIDTATGQIRREITLPFWVTHAQFCPDGSPRILFNQEGFVAHGPGTADVICPRKPRIWVMDSDDEYHPLYDERPDEWACHENWTPSGDHIVYHGALDMGPRLFRENAPGTTGRNFVAMRRWDGTMAVFCETGEVSAHHTTPVSDHMAFISDLWDGRVAVITLGSTPDSMHVIPLCRADSTDMEDQDNHVHARLSPGANSVVFTSNRGGDIANVYEVQLPPGITFECSHG